VGIGVQDHAMLVVPLPTLERTHQSLDGRVTNCVLRYSSGLGAAGENDMMMLPNKFIPLHGGGCLIVQQEQVFSRGRLAIVSRDPAVDPEVDLHLLEDESDRLRMEDAIGRMGEVASHPAFAALLGGRPTFPDPQELRGIVHDVLHVCSSCRMGSPAAVTTVVDPECRVLGTEGLRVIDASIMPEAPRANLHLTVVMIAERMAERLREARQ
jgi:choline dehydrogenase-like flavoprotein